MTDEAKTTVASAPEKCPFAQAAIARMGANDRALNTLKKAETNSDEYVSKRLEIDRPTLLLANILQDCASCTGYPDAEIKPERFDLFGCSPAQAVIDMALKQD